MFDESLLYVHGTCPRICINRQTNMAGFCPAGAELDDSFDDCMFDDDEDDEFDEPFVRKRSPAQSSIKVKEVSIPETLT